MPGGYLSEVKASLVLTRIKPFSELHFGILLLWLVCSAVQATSTSSIDELLAQADAIRVSAPEESERILRNLKTDEITAAQRDYRDYLLAFHKALQSNLTDAIRIIEPLTGRHRDNILALRTRGTLLNLYFGKRGWAEGLLLANELTQLMAGIPRDIHWYTANLAVAHYYLNLGMFQDGLQVLEQVNGVELANVDGEMRCRYLGQEFRARKGVSLAQIQPRWLLMLETACLPLPVTLYSLEPFISWANYLLESQQFAAVLPFIKRYEDAMKGLNFFYFWVAFKNTEAEALLALQRFEEAEQVVDALLANPQIKDYSEGHIIAANVKASARLHQQDYAQAYYWRQVAAESENKQNRLAVTQQLAINYAQTMVNSADESLAFLASSQALLANGLERAEQKVISSYLLLTLIASLAVITVFSIQRLVKQQRLLSERASKDALTGLDNRRRFMDVVQAMLEQSQLSEPVSLIMFDLDNLKWINDNFGHQAGDWVLQQVGVTLCTIFDSSAICCARVGGEEFIMCLPGTSADKALTYCEVIQQALGSIDTQSRLDGLLLSASFGVCDTNLVGRQLNALISGADLAMYQAKKSGRRRAVKYQLEYRLAEEAI